MTHKKDIARTTKKLKQARADLDSIKKVWRPGYEQSEDELRPALERVDKVADRIHYLRVGLGRKVANA